MGVSDQNQMRVVWYLRTPFQLNWFHGTQGLQREIVWKLSLDVLRQVVNEVFKGGAWD